VLKDAEERDIALPVEKLVVNCSPQTANATPGEISSNMARESRVLILVLLVRKTLFKKVLTKNATKLRKRTSRTVA